MATELWFRGEGKGVSPGKAGGSLHDLGDGMYLTDSQDVAKVYAQRRAKAKDGQLVFQARIPMKDLGPVLDLTKDARWRKFMESERLAGRTRLSLLKIKHELYGQFFAEFRKRYKIDITKYNAVIGPEYNLGGKQLCVLHNKGRGATLQQKVRSRFRPAGLIGKRIKLALKLSVKAVFKSRFRIRGVARGTGSVLGAIGVAVLELLLEHWIGEMWKKSAHASATKQIDSLGPKIEETILSQGIWMAELQRQGLQPYANVTIRLAHHQSSKGHMPPVIAEVQDYLDVRISDKSVDEEKDVSPKQGMGQAAAGYKLNVTEVTWSKQVNLAPNYYEFYDVTFKELHWAQQRLNEHAELAGYGIKTDSRDLKRYQAERIVDLATYFGVSAEYIYKHFHRWLIYSL